MAFALRFAANHASFTKRHGVGVSRGDRPAEVIPQSLCRSRTRAEPGRAKRRRVYFCEPEQDVG